MKTLIRGLIVASLALVSFTAMAQQHYTYHGVTRVVRVRILPGKSAEFYKYLGNVSKILAAEKSAGVIEGFAFMESVDYGGPEKYDIAIIIDYKDMATLDTLSQKADPIIASFYGTPEARAAARQLADDSSELVSEELVRGITLK